MDILVFLREHTDDMARHFFTFTSSTSLCRYQIMDAIEGPLKRRIQDELNKVDVENLIHEKIPEIEEQARWMQGLVPAEETVLEELPPPQDLDDETPFSESEENRGPS